MASTAEQMRQYKGPAFFSLGFRPFFLGGAIIAAVIPLLTALALRGVIAPGAAYGLIPWHGHEMAFGYLGAVVAGFILTAIPNWTGRLPILGGRLIGLAALWLAGRIAIYASGVIGAMPAAITDVSFLVVLDLFLWREVIAGKNWRNAPVCMLILLFAVGNIAWHVDLMGGGVGTAPLHWGLSMIAILLALIGGRVTPSFTRNFLVKSGQKPFEAPFGAIDKAALASLVAGLLAWNAAPAHILSGALLLAAGGIHLFRLSRWQGWRVWSEPIVVILHLGYLWLAFAVLALALSILAPDLVTQSTALHVLTTGAAGVMTLGVMTRATRGHTGRPLTADKLTILIYVLVNIGAVLRVAAPYLPLDYATAIMLASTIWSSAFVLFAIVYGRYMITPRQPNR